MHAKNCSKRNANRHAISSIYYLLFQLSENEEYICLGGYFLFQVYKAASVWVSIRKYLDCRASMLALG